MRKCSERKDERLGDSWIPPSANAALGVELVHGATESIPLAKVQLTEVATQCRKEARECDEKNPNAHKWAGSGS